MYAYVTTCKCRVVELSPSVCMCLGAVCLCVGNCMQVYCAGVGYVRLRVCVCVLSQGYVLCGRVSVSCN